MLKRVIANIRGPNASGKTTLARSFYGGQPQVMLVMAEGSPEKVVCSQAPAEGLGLPVTLLGPYDPAAKYAGCDKVKSVEAIRQAVRDLAARPEPCHLIFEGFRVSKSWVPYADLRNEVVRQQEGRVRWLWALSDISEALMMERAQARSPERTLNRDELSAAWRQMRNTIAKARALYPAEEVMLLDARLPPERLRELLVARMAALEYS